jgi:hypothetical protein
MLTKVVGAELLGEGSVVETVSTLRRPVTP